MRQYRFRSPSGVDMLIEMSACEFRKRVRNGKLRTKNKLSGGTTVFSLVTTHVQKTNGTITACWPCECDTVGVEVTQIHEAMANDSRLGVPTDYNPDTGAPIFTSALHRKRWGEANGYFVASRKGTSSSMDPCRLDRREIEARAMAGRSVRSIDDDRLR